MGVRGEGEEARHGFVDEGGAGDEDVVHVGEQVFAGGIEPFFLISNTDRKGL